VARRRIGAYDTVADLLTEPATDIH
jgi:hypothetical protein